MPAPTGDTQFAMSLSAVNTTSSNEVEENTRSDHNTTASLSDDEICMALALGEAAEAVRLQVAAASRTIYGTTKQWPWEWVGLSPPKYWKLYMVQDLALVLQHVARDTPGFHGPGNKPTFEDVKMFMRRCAASRGKLAPLKGSDISGAMWHFGASGNASVFATQEKKHAPGERSQADRGKEQDQEQVGSLIAIGKQHNDTQDTGNQCEKDISCQANKGSKATASPLSKANSPGSVVIPEKMVKLKALNADHSAPSPSASSKKRSHMETASSGRASAPQDRPAKRGHLSTDEPTADPDLSAPTVKDPAADMTKDTDLATLQNVVKRRRVKSSLEYTTLKKKVDVFQGELKIRKSFVEAGTILTMESRSKLAECEKAFENAVNDLEKVRRTIEDYSANKDLLGTLGFATRELVAEDHKRTLWQMEGKRVSAGVRLKTQRRKVEAEREEAKKRIEEDETKLVKMKADLELAHTESDRWGCIENLTVMKAVDLKRVVAGLEKEGVVLLECPEKQG
ncbi:hypothetical protein CDV31_007013 [Fusarium ambrosium]|uniref:Uncharacterized protein n=1 Tax=Fusarium ambrosium TaxID=131363 RepID=A0A428U9C1_9HYPO|nr:hypothetical protein CDV31_007013 [Fusarium ambrosium]